MTNNAIKLNIAGTQYSIVSDEPAAYMMELGAQLDREMRSKLENPRVSTTMAAVLVALETADAARKAEATADNLRSQMKDYLDDNARARMEADSSRRELERLRSENSELRARLGQRPEAHEKRVGKQTLSDPFLCGSIRQFDVDARARQPHRPHEGAHRLVVGVNDVAVQVVEGGKVAYKQQIAVVLGLCGGAHRGGGGEDPVDLAGQGVQHGFGDGDVFGFASPVRLLLKFEHDDVTYHFRPSVSGKIVNRKYSILFSTCHASCIDGAKKPML